MTNSKKVRKEGKWDWVVDVLLFIPELIIIPIRLVFRGIFGLFKHWG
ncbi:hypothetical protein [Alteribacillus iranensis]|uniref:Uncharacterized protein n=1 Tax=Alteribacillus iranensis TaxID=930128 RepID=A0A1I1ZUF4_9BACI|nr:hypothetical protein [Alteribacillus iranensis]SFE35242.1 hypothetical protein SAMN05192532_101448 [Alteribacillus iranensis]